MSLPEGTRTKTADNVGAVKGANASWKTGDFGWGVFFWRGPLECWCFLVRFGTEIPQTSKCPVSGDGESPFVCSLGVVLAENAGHSLCSAMVPRNTENRSPRGEIQNLVLMCLRKNLNPLLIEPYLFQYGRPKNQWSSATNIWNSQFMMGWHWRDIQIEGLRAYMPGN